MNEQTTQKILDFRCPRYQELPALDLYMDQVLIYIEGVIDLFYVPEEKRLTASMINNYVKQKVLPPPVKKKYTRDHVADLLTMCLLKKVFSIPEIDGMIKLQVEHYPVETAYNSFVEEFETALKSAFSNEGIAAKHESDEMKNLLQSVVLSLASKIYVQMTLANRQ